MFYSLAHILVGFFLTFNFLLCLFPLPHYSSRLVSPACDYPPVFYSLCLPPHLCRVSPPFQFLTCVLLVNINSCVFKSLLVLFCWFWLIFLWASPQKEAPHLLIPVFAIFFKASGGWIFFLNLFRTFTFCESLFPLHFGFHSVKPNKRLAKSPFLFF